MVASRFRIWYNGSMRKRGAVSLYVVIFATLLLMVVTLSFVRIMLQEQRNTAGDDMSQAAWDAALAGVEDARVAILQYNRCISSGDTSARCEELKKLMRNETMTGNPHVCDRVAVALGRSPNQETLIQEGNVGNVGQWLDQAYTCVQLSGSAGDYLGQLGDGAARSQMIPLRAESTFNRIQINWGSSNDFGVAGPNIPGGAPPQRLFNNPRGGGMQAFEGLFDNSWPSNTPIPLTAHLIQTSSDFTLTGFDNPLPENATTSGTTNRGALTFIPVAGGTNVHNGTTPLALGLMLESNNKNTVNRPVAVHCEAPSPTRAWACTATFDLPSPIGGGRNMGTSFLRLENIVGLDTSDYQVLLFDGNSPVAFAGVQVVVDSTGRAGDRFRRIEGRIEVVDVGFAYPDFTLDMRGGGPTANFCKDYIVTINSWDGNNSVNDGNCP